MLQQPPLQLHVLHLRLYHHQRGILGEWKVSYIWSLVFNRIMLITALVGNMMTRTYNNVWRGLDSSIFSFSLHSRLRVVTTSCKHSQWGLVKHRLQVCCRMFVMKAEDWAQVGVGAALLLPSATVLGLATTMFLVNFENCPVNFANYDWTLCNATHYT